jgi:hypothetical protein
VDLLLGAVVEAADVFEDLGQLPVGGLRREPAPSAGGLVEVVVARMDLEPAVVDRQRRELPAQVRPQLAALGERGLDQPRRPVVEVRVRRDPRVLEHMGAVDGVDLLQAPLMLGARLVEAPALGVDVRAHLVLGHRLAQEPRRRAVADRVLEPQRRRSPPQRSRRVARPSTAQDVVLHRADSTPGGADHEDPDGPGWIPAR